MMRVINKLSNLTLLDLNLTSPNLHFSIAKRLLDNHPGVLFGFIPVDTTYSNGTDIVILPCLSNINDNKDNVIFPITSDFLIPYSDISNQIITTNSVDYYFKVKICGQDPYTLDVNTNTFNTLSLSIANIPNYITISGKSEGEVPFDYMGGLVRVALSGCDTVYIPNVVNSADTTHSFIVGLILSNINDVNNKIIYSQPVVIVIDETDYDDSNYYWNRNIVRLFKVELRYSSIEDYIITVDFDNRDEFILSEQLNTIKSLLTQIKLN